MHTPHLTCAALLALAVLPACASRPPSESAPPTASSAAKQTGEDPKPGQTPPPMASPRLEQHRWLEQLVGEWETKGTMVMEPGAEPLITHGTESSRTLGGLWYVCEIQGESPMGPMQGLMTIGYDEEERRYVGTWVDSVMNHMWHYRGTVDGKVLTLEAEGPGMDGTGTAKYRDVWTVNSPDKKTLTSMALGPDGKWTTFMTVECKRRE
jgi:hypothetical protein